MKNFWIIPALLTSVLNAFAVSWTANGISAAYQGGRNWAVTLPEGTTAATIVCDPSGMPGDHTYMRYTFNNSLALADVPGWWTVPQDQPQNYWTGNNNWEWRPPQTMERTIWNLPNGTFRVIVEGENYDWTQSYVLTITVPGNAPPQINWIQNPANVPISNWFAIQSRGDDPDGNLSSVWVWKEWVPFAVNGGGNGFVSYSDPNMTVGWTAGPINFQTQAFDTWGANSAMIFHTVNVYNRAPYAATLNANTSPGTYVTWNSVGQCYEMWIEEPGNPSKPGTISLTGNVKDDDGNLMVHRMWKWRNGTATSDDWNSPIYSAAPNNASNSTVILSNYKPNLTGRWDFHTNAQDSAGAWSSGASVTVYVYGPTNNAELISFKVNGTTYPANSGPISLSADNNASIPIEVTMRNSSGDSTPASKPWTTDSTPHQLGIVGDDTRWGPSRIALPSQPIVPAPQTPNTATFSFNLTMPTAVYSNQSVRFQMVEQGLQWFGPMTPSLVITVIDSLPPTNPTWTATPVTNLTHTGFTVSWNASTDNSGVVAGYEIALYRKSDNAVVVAPTLQTATTYTFSGLAEDTAYTIKVRAKDGKVPAPNWSGYATRDVTTKLDPAGDYDNDGVPNGIEDQLGTDPKSPRQNDAGNSTQLKIHRPY